VAADGTMYWTTLVRGAGGIQDWLVRKARPETAEAVTLTRLEGARIPSDFRHCHPSLSPDGKWLAQPLLDGPTSNLWLISTQDGSLRRVTDFGARPTVIARRVSWSRDSAKIYAAVAETDEDVVLFQNLLPE
jgi:Tol biopolymer transport system component